MTGTTSWRAPPGEAVAHVKTERLELHDALAAGQQEPRDARSPPPRSAAQVAPCRLTRASAPFALPARARGGTCAASDEAGLTAGVALGIHGEPPSVEDAARVGAQLLLELDIYSREFYEQIAVHEIVLVANLHYRSQRRYDVPDLAAGVLFIDVERKFRWHLSHSFHHELFHMADYHMLGATYVDTDEEFAKLNALTAPGCVEDHARPPPKPERKRQRLLGGWRRPPEPASDSGGVTTGQAEAQRAEQNASTLGCVALPGTPAAAVQDRVGSGGGQGGGGEAGSAAVFPGYGFGRFTGVDAATEMREHLMEKRHPPPPTSAFLNMYSTSSVGEDKAECWAALVLYPERLRTSAALMRKAGLLLSRITAQLPSGMDGGRFTARADAARVRRLAINGPPVVPSHLVPSTGGGEAAGRRKGGDGGVAAAVGR